MLENRQLIITHFHVKIVYKVVIEVVSKVRTKSLKYIIAKVKENVYTIKILRLVSQKCFY